MILQATLNGRFNRHPLSVSTSYGLQVPTDEHGSMARADGVFLDSQERGHIVPEQHLSRHLNAPFEGSLFKVRWLPVLYYSARDG
ncbi:hypothetical protein BC835DRAFT_748688 [Cytidiella melzeri]|nr:hypothetical protein BC835DRAFT_748688 [Cytidiella melzeri]